MKNKNRVIETVDIQQELDNMLAEALKQPGVEAVMQLAEAAEKYSQPANQYNFYIDWQRFPVLSNSCTCPEPQSA